MRKFTYIACAAVIAMSAPAGAHTITYNLGVGHPSTTFPHGGEVALKGGGLYDNAGKLVITIGSAFFSEIENPQELYVEFRLNNFAQGDPFRSCQFQLEAGPPHVDEYGNQRISIWPNGSWVEGVYSAAQVSQNTYGFYVRNIDDKAFTVGEVLGVGVYCPSRTR